METQQLTVPELRSDDIHEIINRDPHWLVRNGISLFFGILLLLFVGTWFIKYPDIVAVPFRLTSTISPQAIVAKTNGRITKLWVKDNELVRIGQKLAYLESTAKHDEVLALEQTLDSLSKLISQGRFESIANFRTSTFDQLGELQADYQLFMQQFTKISLLFVNGYHQQHKRFLMAELNDLAENHSQLSEQYLLQNRELELAAAEFKIQKRLYKDGLIAPLEYHREESKFIAKNLPIKQLDMNLTHNKTSQTQKRKEIVELDRQAAEQKAAFIQVLHTLRSSLLAWKIRFVPTATQNGRLNYTSLWQEQQVVKNEDILFYIGQNTGALVGEAKLRQINFGKIAVGQRVFIKFDGFPFEQFGGVEGRVISIANIPSVDSSYRAVITLSNGLQTSYHKKLPFKNGLNATAEIITADQRLPERAFYGLKKLLKR
jgi:multidrug resistance efflux pump